MTIVQCVEKFSPNLEGCTPDQLVSMCSVIDKQGRESVTGIGRAFEGVLFVEANEMFIGIEKDGYAHT